VLLDAPLPFAPDGPLPELEFALLSVPQALTARAPASARGRSALVRESFTVPPR
jgi:hypothetical protein